MSRKSKPNLYEFIDSLKNHQIFLEDEISELECGRAPKAQKSKFKKINTEILQLKLLAEEGDISWISFLTQVGYKLKLQS